MRWLSRAFVVVGFAVAAQGALVNVMDGAPDGDGAEKAWEKLVGRPVDEAVKAIEADAPKLGIENVVAISADSMVTMDFRMDRVRVFHDASGTVVRAPKTG